MKQQSVWLDTVLLSKKCVVMTWFGKPTVNAVSYSFARAYARIGNVHLKRKSYEEAINFYQQSLAEHKIPDNAKKLQQAKRLLEEQKKKEYLDPDKAEAARQEGNELFKQGLPFIYILKQVNDIFYVKNVRMVFSF